MWTYPLSIEQPPSSIIENTLLLDIDRRLGGWAALWWWSDHHHIVVAENLIYHAGVMGVPNALYLVNKYNGKKKRNQAFHSSHKTDGA